MGDEDGLLVVHDVAGGMPPARLCLDPITAISWSAAGLAVGHGKKIAVLDLVADGGAQLSGPADRFVRSG
jgi:hypothetical protein